MSDSIEYQLGVLHGRLDAFEKAALEREARRDAEFKEMQDDVKAIRTAVDQAKGGGRMLLWMIGASGTAGAFFGWFVTHIWPRSGQ